MSTFSYEAAWLCLAVTAALGGLVLCKLKKSSGQVGRKVVCLAGCWGGACLLSLSLFWGLILFSLSCFLMHIYLSGQELLPVDQKAVLITASSLCARTRAVLSLQGGVFHSRDLALKDSYTQIIHNLPNLRLDPTNDGRDFCSPANLAPPCGNSRIKDAYSKVVEKVQNRGGDSGIGHALSKYLDHLGFTVIAGVLNEKGSGAEELRRTCSKRLSVLQLDVTDPQQIKDAYSKVVEKVQNRGLWALVNNAGVLGLPADGELIPMTDYKRCMAVNFFGAVEVTKAFLPLLRKSKGRLVNISSMAGGAPMVKLAAYGSSKAALTMFSAVMRQELSKWGVKVAVIQPGGFKTNIAGSSETWDKLEKDMLDQLTPEVREDYGQDYILAQRNFVSMVHRHSNPDVCPVLLDLRHAISAKSPFTFYTPGSGTYLRLCFVSFSPTGIYDYFNKKLHSSERMPSALNMPNWKNQAT